MRELRQNASKYLERVKRGESIEVTERGVPIAVLGPVPVVAKSRYLELLEQGVISPGQGELWHWLEANPPVPVDSPGASMAQLLDEQREDRL